MTRPCSGLPAAALLGGLDPVVHGVAHHVHQGIVDDVHQVAVDLGLLALGDEVDVLAELARHVPGQARHLAEGGFQRHHAHGHADVLQLPHDLGRVGDLFGQAVVSTTDHKAVLGHHRMRDDELAHHVDQAVQPLGAHAHAGIHQRPAGSHLRLRAQRLADVGDARRPGLDQGDPRLFLGVLVQGRFDLLPLRLALRDEDVADPRGRGLRRFLGDPGRLGVLEGGQQFVITLRLAKRRAGQGLPDDRHQVLDHVERLEGEIGVASAVSNLPVPHPAQQGLGVMPHFGDPGQVEKTGGALDGVEGAKNLAHGFHVFRVVLEGEQRLFGVLDQLRAFIDELRHEVRVEVGRQALRAADGRTRRRGRRGRGSCRRGSRRQIQGVHGVIQQLADAGDAGGEVCGRAAGGLTAQPGGPVQAVPAGRPARLRAGEPHERRFEPPPPFTIMGVEPDEQRRGVVKAQRVRWILGGGRRPVRTEGGIEPRRRRQRAPLIGPTVEGRLDRLERLRHAAHPGQQVRRAAAAQPVQAVDRRLQQLFHGRRLGGRRFQGFRELGGHGFPGGAVAHVDVVQPLDSGGDLRDQSLSALAHPMLPIRCADGGAAAVKCCCKAVSR